MIDVRTDLLAKSHQLREIIEELRSKQAAIELLLQALERHATCYDAGFDPAEVTSSKMSERGNRHVLKLRDGSTLEVSSQVAASLRLLYGIKA